MELKRLFVVRMNGFMEAQDLTGLKGLEPFCKSLLF